MTLRCG
ncbi:hypothetical protein E2C01_070429 [Portunus trituberculatus]|nr:hypothetical protein [Portunus trituberculatus]